MSMSLDSYIATIMARYQIPGLAIAITHRGAILEARGYGRASV